MTNSRTPKRRKLRNSEYYDLQSAFDGLYADSKAGKIFTDLRSVIVSDENIRLTYRNLKTNSGSKTPGVDGKTIDDLKRWDDSYLIRTIQKAFRKHSNGTRLDKFAGSKFPRTMAKPAAGDTDDKRPAGTAVRITGFGTCV